MDNMSKSEEKNRNWEEFKEVIRQNIEKLNEVLDVNQCEDGYWDFPLQNIPGKWYCGLQFNKAKNGICLSFNTDGRNLDFQAQIKKFLNGKIMDSDYTLEEILSNKTIQREQGILGSFLLKPQKTSDNHYLWCIKTAIEFSAYLYEFKAQLEGSTSFAQADQMDNKYHNSFAVYKSKNASQLHQSSDNAIVPSNKVCYINALKTASTFKMTPEAFNTFGDTEITGFEKKCVQVKKVASWAIWNEPSGDNYNTISGMKLHGMFSTGLEKVLPQLNPNIVLLGLNCSQNPCDADGAWQNFHLREQDDESILTPTNRPGQWLRYACRNTMFRGAYMTDLFKSLTDPHSGNVVKYFQNNEQGLQMAAESFSEEMKALRTLSTDNTQPLVIICLGNAVYDYLKKGYKKGSNLFIKALHDKLPGIHLIVGFAYHYSYPIRCGYTDEQSLNVYLEHFQEVQQIIEESVHNNNVIITKKPSRIDRSKQ